MIVGSNYFFSGIKGFKPKDIDVLILEESNEYKYLYQHHCPGKCIFKVNSSNTKDDLIEFHKKLNDPITIGKFLIPEFNNYFGITIEDIKELKFIFDKLDKKHLYQKKIYDYYIENGSFTLTDNQLNECYNLYKLYRHGK